MNDRNERVELLAALHAAGAATQEDEQELAALLEADPGLQQVVSEFEESITALASSFDPLETSATSLTAIKKQIKQERGGLLARLRAWWTK